MLLLGSTFSFGQIPPPPNPPRLVNDFAGVLTAEQRDALEAKLVAYNDSTSSEMAIVLVNDLGGDDVAAFAQSLAESWGIGKKGKDNGILILASIPERKMTIQTGYGVEDRVTDAATVAIREELMKPAFKQKTAYAMALCDWSSDVCSSDLLI